MQGAHQPAEAEHAEPEERLGRRVLLLQVVGGDHEDQQHRGEEIADGREAEPSTAAPHRVRQHHQPGPGAEREQWQEGAGDGGRGAHPCRQRVPLPARLVDRERGRLARRAGRPERGTAARAGPRTAGAAWGGPTAWGDGPEARGGGVAWGDGPEARGGGGAWGGGVDAWAGTAWAGGGAEGGAAGAAGCESADGCAGTLFSACRAAEAEAGHPVRDAGGEGRVGAQDPTVQLA